MKILALTPRQARARVVERYSLREGMELAQRVAEIVRAELVARGTCRPHILKGHVAQRAGVLGASGELIAEVISELERLGDITAGAGGLLASAPIRAVVLDTGRRLVFGGAPTAQLGQLLGCDLEFKGLARRATGWGEAHDRSLAEHGGLALSAEQWSGLSRAPVAGRGWWDTLILRLHASREARDLSDIVGENASQRYDPSSSGASHYKRWISIDRDLPARPTLVRAKGFGHHPRHHLIAGREASQSAAQQVSVLKWLSLSRSEARRLCFALDRLSDNPTALRVVKGRGEAGWIESPNVLPYEEYRYLTAVSDAIFTRSFPMKFVLPAARLKETAQQLQRRLGVELVHAFEGDSS